uniref:Uncharacterized protein n=1 Tax=Lepeophtheirus salmonis TaxID=72036 RepID=A0A0K2UDD8_LEPSM
MLIIDETELVDGLNVLMRKCSEEIFIFLMSNNNDEGPQILSCLLIKKNLQYEAFYNGVKILYSPLKCYINNLNFTKVNSIHDVRELIIYLKRKEQNISDIIQNGLMKSAQALLEKLIFAAWKLLRRKK